MWICAGRVCALNTMPVISRIKETSSQWTLSKLDGSFPRWWKSRFKMAISRCLPTTGGLNITTVLSLIVNTSGLSQLHATWCPPSNSIITAGIRCICSYVTSTSDVRKVATLTYLLGRWRCTGLNSLRYRLAWCPRNLRHTWSCSANATLASEDVNAPQPTFSDAGAA